MTAELVGTARPASSQPAPTTRPTRAVSPAPGMYLPADDAAPSPCGCGMSSATRSRSGSFPSVVNLQGGPAACTTMLPARSPVRDERRLYGPDARRGDRVRDRGSTVASCAEPDRRMLHSNLLRFPPTCEEHC